MMTATTVRRVLLGAFAGGLMTATVSVAAPTASAEPDPCSVGGVSDAVSSVSEQFSQYLDANPDTNEALTEISRQPADQADTAYQAFFAENPQTADDLRELRQPLAELDTQCGTQVTSTQVVDALQAL